MNREQYFHKRLCEWYKQKIINESFAWIPDKPDAAATPPRLNPTNPMVTLRYREFKLGWQEHMVMIPMRFPTHLAQYSHPLCVTGDLEASLDAALRDHPHLSLVMVSWDWDYAPHPARTHLKDLPSEPLPAGLADALKKLFPHEDWANRKGITMQFDDIDSDILAIDTRTEASDE